MFKVTRVIKIISKKNQMFIRHYRIYPDYIFGNDQVAAFMLVNFSMIRQFTVKF